MATYGYVQRTVSPSYSDKNWIKTTYNGYNNALLINKKDGSCIPNCCGYVHGRMLENLTGAIGLAKAMEYEAKMCRNNAEMYWGYTQDGLSRGQTPKLGAIICWAKGKVGNQNDGAGHVMIVEEIRDNGDIVCSGSNYGGTRWYKQTYKKSTKYSIGSKYAFQGFIYPPVEFSTHVVTPVNRNALRDQIQVKITNLNCRTGAGTSNKRLGYCDVGYYNVMQTKENINGYTWYEIEPDKWCAGVDGVTYLPKKTAVTNYMVVFKKVSETQMKELQDIASKENLAVEVTKL